MSRINTILGQLQDRLNIMFNHPTSTKESELSGGSGFLNQYPPDDDKDVDTLDAADVNYTTQLTFILPTGTKQKSEFPFRTSKRIKEQEDEEDPLEDTTKMDEEPVDVGAEPAMDTDVGGGMDTGMDTGMGGDMGGMPGMEQEEPKTAGQLGRIYELKKIYSRLTSIESYLGNESSTELLEIRNLVSKSIELFEIVSANFDSYKDKLDEIIVTYYKFLLEVYKEVEKYFKQEAKSSGD